MQKPGEGRVGMGLLQWYYNKVNLSRKEFIDGGCTYKNAGSSHLKYINIL